MQKRVMKYMTRIGQNTGILNTWKKVQQKAITWIFLLNLIIEIKKVE